MPPRITPLSSASVHPLTPSMSTELIPPPHEREMVNLPAESRRHKKKSSTLQFLELKKELDAHEKQIDDMKYGFKEQMNAMRDDMKDEFEDQRKAMRDDIASSSVMRMNEMRNGHVKRMDKMKDIASQKSTSLESRRHEKKSSKLPFGEFKKEMNEMRDDIASISFKLNFLVVWCGVPVMDTALMTDRDKGQK